MSEKSVQAVAHKKARLIEHECLIVQHMNVRPSTSLHFYKGELQVASVELMIPAHVKHRTIEHVIGPLHPARLRVNITGENDDVGISWTGIKRRKLEMQIGIDSNFH